MNKAIFEKTSTLFLLSFLIIFSACAQGNKADRPSPPAVASAKVSGVNVKIDYSQPSKKGRLVWGGLVKYDQVWRTGANEATVFEISADVRVEGQLLKAGKYALFTIPGKDKWTVIFNSKSNQWGAYKHNTEKDVLRVDVTPSYGNPSVEKFNIDVNKEGVVTMKWDDAVVSFKVS